MLTASAAASAPAAAPYAVGNFQKGETRTDLTRQWIARPADEKFLTLADLERAVKARYDASREDRIDSRTIELVAPEPKSRDDMHKLSVGLPDGRTAALTHWSFGQLCTLAKAPASYLRTLPSTFVADNLMWSLKWERGENEVKTYSTAEQMLAATGPDYGRIPDFEVVSAVRAFAGEGATGDRFRAPGVLNWATMMYDPKAEITADTTSYFASDRDVWIMLVDSENPIEVGKLPNGEPDLLTRGFIITNSEVGRSSLKLFAFYFRASCCNRLLWGVEQFQELTMRHSKYAPARFLEEARPAIASFANGSTTRLVEAVQQAKAAKIAKDEDDALAFLRDRKFSRTKAMAILEQGEKEEGRPVRSAWDFAQALTANARSIAYTDERIDQERVAKSILDKVA